MSILLTGANGFLGRYIIKSFTGRPLVTLGLTGCDINIDLSRNVPEFPSPVEKVIHAAGLAHVVPKSLASGQRFFDVNVTGTLNLLKGLERAHQLPEDLVFISTVAVYGMESGETINENTSLSGVSPYALSKIQAEDEVQRWGARNNVRILTLRLPLIAGINPPGNLGAIIRAIRKGYYFRIGDGGARKSIVLADDVATLIARCNGCSGIYNLTDGVHPYLHNLDEAIASQLGRRIKVLPRSVVEIAARIGDILPFLPLNTLKLSKLTSTLTFSDAKARKELGWKPRPVVGNLEI
jgi:nucleoside-diphosphate-sugar epimerase